MNIGTLIDNSGHSVNYIMGLKEGDVLMAMASEMAKGDIGTSGLVYDYQAFVIGNKYKVRNVVNWDGHKVAYVTDEDNTLHFATPDIFDIFVE